MSKSDSKLEQLKLQYEQLKAKSMLRQKNAPYSRPPKSIQPKSEIQEVVVEEEALDGPKTIELDALDILSAAEQFLVSRKSSKSTKSPQVTMVPSSMEFFIKGTDFAISSQFPKVDYADDKEAREMRFAFRTVFGAHAQRTEVENLKTLLHLCFSNNTIFRKSNYFNVIISGDDVEDAFTCGQNTKDPQPLSDELWARFRKVDQMLY